MDPLALNAYINSFSRDLIDIDERKDRTRIDYQSALDTLRRNRRRDISGLSAGMANRGLTHSGAGLKERMDLDEGYNRRQDSIGQAKATTLSSLARRKLNTESDLNEVRSYA